jgi:hypothetical protein
LGTIQDSSFSLLYLEKAWIVVCTLLLAFFLEQQKSCALWPSRFWIKVVHSFEISRRGRWLQALSSYGHIERSQPWWKNFKFPGAIHQSIVTPVTTLSILLSQGLGTVLYQIGFIAIPKSLDLYGKLKR